MISLDTNLLLYARLEGCPQHVRARTFIEQIHPRSDIAIAELVLVEFYLALRNPAIIEQPLTAPEAAEECAHFRRHPRWALIENAEIMSLVWPHAGSEPFARRRIIDLRLAKTLQAHGVTEFATANLRDFQNVGFERVWNPLESEG